MTDWEDNDPSGPTDWVPGPDGLPSSYIYVPPVGSTVQLDASSIQSFPISGVDPLEGQYLRFVSGSWTAETLVGGGGGTSDHSLLTNLTNDDHTQYLNTARHILSTHTSSNVDHGNIAGLTDDDHSQYLNATRHNLASHTATNVDHGTTAGLGDDDHAQYLNTARHDLTVRHGIGTVVPSGTPGSSAPGDVAAAGSANFVARSDHLHGREAHGSGQHGAAVVLHGSIGNLGNDDHTQYLNNARHDVTARHPAGVFAGTQTSGFVLTLSGTTPTWLVASGGGVTFGSPASSNPGDVSADGVSGSATRADHKHAREAHTVSEHGPSIVSHATIGDLSGDNHTQYLNNARHDLTARHGSAVLGIGTATDYFALKAVSGTLIWQRDFAGLIQTLPLAGNRWSAIPSSGGAALSLNNLFAMPFWLERSITIDQLAARVSTAVATAAIRLGIYSDTGNGYPNALLGETASIAAAVVGTVSAALGVAQTIGPGLYWFAIVAQTAAANMAKSANIYTLSATTAALALASAGCKSYVHSGVIGALPATFTATILAAVQNAAIGYRRT